MPRRTSVALPYEARDTAGLGSKGFIPVRKIAQCHKIFNLRRK